MKKLKISNTTYDNIKNTSLYAIPIIATFIASVGQIWGVPYIDKIMLTFSALEVAIAGIISKAKHDYNESDETETEKGDE